MSESFLQNQRLLEDRVIEKRIGSMISTDAPVVSVVIPCYNNCSLISETLETVFAQTFSDYEIILINDGSPDTPDLEKILATFYEKIIYVKQRNHGASSARNAGIFHSRGKYIAFLDGDDLWLPEYLEAQLKFLAAGDFQMVYADALLFGQKISEGKTFMQTSPSRGAVTTEKLILTECNVITSGTIIEKSQITMRGGFDESAEAARVEDFDLWFGLAKQGCRIGFQRRVLLKYRVGSTGLSGGSVSRAERSVQAYKLIKAKNDLTDGELSAWNLQMNRAMAQLALEKGKFYLVKENFEQSLIHLAEANRYFPKRKLELLIWLMKYRPRFVKRIYKKFRADEFDFVDSAAYPKEIN